MGPEEHREETGCDSGGNALARAFMPSVYGRFFMADSRSTHALDRPLGRPRAMTDAERRQHIVAAAAAVFAKKGYWATTMDEISRQAGMSKKTLYQLFASKAEIFDLLLRNFTHPFSVPFETDGRTQREILTAGLFRLVTSALDDAQVEISRVLIAEAARPGDVADAIERLGICRGNSALQQWLGSQTSLGRFPVRDPEDMAATIFWAAAGDALINLLLRIRPRPNIDAITTRIEHVVGLYFD